ncbi:hypothetical protein DV515_00005714, partial [Chloebia gouldiae]
MKHVKLHYIVGETGQEFCLRHGKCPFQAHKEVCFAAAVMPELPWLSEQTVIPKRKKKKGVLFYPLFSFSFSCHAITEGNLHSFCTAEIITV